MNSIPIQLCKSLEDAKCKLYKYGTAYLVPYFNSLWKVYDTRNGIVTSLIPRASETSCIPPAFFSSSWTKQENIHINLVPGYCCQVPEGNFRRFFRKLALYGEISLHDVPYTRYVDEVPCNFTRLNKINYTIFWQNRRNVPAIHGYEIESGIFQVLNKNAVSLVSKLNLSSPKSKYKTQKTCTVKKDGTAIPKKSLSFQDDMIWKRWVPCIFAEFWRSFRLQRPGQGPTQPTARALQFWKPNLSLVSIA